MMSPKPDLHAYTTSVEYILASIMHITFVGKGRWDPGGRLTNKQTNNITTSQLVLIEYA